MAQLKGSIEEKRGGVPVAGGPRLLEIVLEGGARGDQKREEQQPHHMATTLKSVLVEN